MLKMTIDNEEVVSKNNFTIKEEMLSPSSTILNNTYPKSWEDDKNYTSRFYYPKDYAKLDIQNFSITPEEAGTTIDIVGSATLTDVDTTKESRVLSLKGQTSQTTYSGKNLFVNNFTQTTVNGITITPNSDGSITINGTSTSSGTTDIYSIGTATTYVPISISDGTYTLSGSGNNNCLILAVLRNSSSQNTIITSGATASTYQNITGIVSARLFIRISAGASFTNFKIYPQLEKSSTATSFEKYVGGTASPNPSYPQPVNVVSGDNTIKVEGKNLWGFLQKNFISNNSTTSTIINVDTLEVTSANNSYANTRYKVDLPNGTYTFKLGKVTNTNSDMTTKRMSLTQFINGVRSVIQHIDEGNSYTFTIANEENKMYTLEFWASYATALINTATFEGIQIEKGSTATTYEPYIGKQYPIYLGGNVFKLSDIEENKAIVGTTGVINSSSVSNISGYVPVIENLTYRLTFDYTTLLNSTDRGICYFDKNKQFISGGNLPMTNKNQLIAIPSGIRYVRFSYDKNLTDINFTTDTTPIELCKIGTYQDKIYKENGNWYLHKEIGKVVLDGSENWQSVSSVVSETSRFYCNVSGILQTSGASNAYYYSDKFVPLNWDKIYTSDTTTRNAICMYGISQRCVIRIDNTYANSVATFKTWLASNNVPVYYVLATPTTTQITDTTLLEQLDALESQ